MTEKYFKVLTGPKKPGKKHQEWKGDAIVRVNGSIATLLNEDNYQIMGSTTLQSGIIFEEGVTEFDIGSTVVQIQESIEKPAKMMSETPDEPVAPAAPPPSKPNTYKLASPYSLALMDNPSKGFKSPLIKPGENGFSPGAPNLKKPVQKKKPLYNPESGFLLPRPPDMDEDAVTDVVVDPKLCKPPPAPGLREHQRKGVEFMYKCIMGWAHEYGSGCILADEMGLGKTLQCISLIWTVLNQGPVNGNPIAKRVIIIAPAGLVNNWVKEFKKWLGDLSLTPYAIMGKNTVDQFIQICRTPAHRYNRVLLISYEHVGKNEDKLSQIDFDLLICDEGHRLKNIKGKTVQKLTECIKTERRIILTGTPIQNNLKELYALVNFVNPSALGKYSKFESTYERPIVAAEQADASPEQRENGQFQQSQLNLLLSEFMLRRTSDSLSDYLPSKTEYIICCRPLDSQVKLYKSLLQTDTVSDLMNSSRGSSECIFKIINQLRKVCNHPRLMQMKEDDENDPSALVPLKINNKSLVDASAKLAVLDVMLKYIKQNTQERVVIVSNFTRTLDILQELCLKRSYTYSRIDGQVQSTKRQEIVDQFNVASSRTFVMLLSTKAGGVGLNLIGASRLILYDMDWNPAHDAQARARIWRDGQRRNVHVYSLLTTGTIEEKIFQRQVMKQGLAGVVGDGGKSTKFTKEELKDIFTLDEATKSSTHDLISAFCNCSQTENQDISMEPKKKKVKIQNKFDLFDEDEKAEEASENLCQAEIKSWDHLQGDDLVDFDLECIPVSSGQITFVFRNKSSDQEPPKIDQETV